MLTTAKFRLLAFIAVVALMAALPALASAKQTRAGSSSITYAKFQKSTALPSAVIRASGGGDGYDVFFDNAGHVFNIYHHDNPASIDCHTLTGGSCGPGWPFSVSPYHTAHWVSGYVDNTNHKLWFPTNSASYAGFGCVDISNFATGPAWCGGSSDVGKGFIENTNTSLTFAGSYGGADRIVNIGTKIYSLTQKGLLICLDTATAANCATSFVDTTAGTNARGDSIYLLAVGDNIFGVGGPKGSTKAFCFTSSMAACAGWVAPTLTGSYNVVYRQPATPGGAFAEGICFKQLVTSASATAACFKPDASATVPENPDLAKTMVAFSTEASAFPLPLTVGTRVYTGDGQYDDTGAFGCYDVATSAKCAGSWPINAGIYAIVADPTTPGCVWTNNNRGEIKSYLADGTLGCFSASAATAFAPTLPCTGGTIANWQSFALPAPATGYTAATLTVTNAAGAVVTSNGKTWSGVKIEGATRTVDLTGLAVKDTGTTPTFTVAYSGLTATGDATASVVMGVKDATGCTSTATVTSPFSASTTAKKKRLNLGDATTLTLRARNGGTSTSFGTKIVCVVPSGFKVVRASGAKVKGQKVTWKIGTLKSKASASRQLTLRAVGRGSHSVGFTVTSDNLASTQSTAAVFAVSGGGSAAAAAVTG